MLVGAQNHDKQAYEDDRVTCCPACGKALYGDDEVYIYANGAVIGCESCVSSKSAWEVLVS